MEQELELLQGSVESVIFQNPENGYTILHMAEDGGETVTVVGVIPMAMAGERLLVTGHWTNHPSYGRQFEAEFLERLMPETARDILAYLSSRAVKGVGPVTAKRIVDAFGAMSLHILENEPERLTEIEGMSRKKALTISEEFRRQVSVRRLIEYLSAHGLPVELAVRLYRSYGAMAMDTIRDDPYLMTDPLFGADFAAVDAFAMELGVSSEDPRRIEAGLLFELSHNLNNGHVFIPRDKLQAVSTQLLEVSSEPVAEALERLLQEQRIMGDTLLGRELCYLPEWYEAETEVARRLRELSGKQEPLPRELPYFMENIAAQQNIAYGEAQMEAIRTAAGEHIMVVTGGPGTGKTTTMAGILALYDRMGLKTQLAAPTGRAAKRLTECTGREATTIHRLLESQYDPESGMLLFIHDETEPLKADALIVDEASMIDLMLMAALLRAMKSDCRLVLVGDPDQLPSVGAGNVFSDILRSGTVKTVRLTEIFRQAQESLIVMNAHAINHGELPTLTAKDKDFFFLRRLESEGLVKTIQDLCSTRLPEKMHIPAGEIQVLTPTRKGVTGTGNLNRCLQAVLNPKSPQKREKTYGNFIYREGDRVMQIRNNYDLIWRMENGAGSGKGVFNGDIGVIRSIDLQEQTVTVAYEDRLAEYAFDMLSELEPAYAMTVHKSQGSEYRAVVLSLLGGSPYLLTRSILYTAVTRARELLIVVGDEQAVAAMVHNDRQTRRYSGLKLRLEAES